MSSLIDYLSLLPLAIKNEHVVSAERYISGEIAPLLRSALLGCTDVDLPIAVALAMFFYDYALTFGDEFQYIWRRPISGIKILYLILRYGVAMAELVYFRGESLLDRERPNSIFIWHMLWRIALSGLASHLSHNVCILLSCTLKMKNLTLIIPSCWVIVVVCDAEMLTFLPSCVGSVYVVAVVGSMALVLANCENCLGFVIT